MHDGLLILGVGAIFIAVSLGTLVAATATHQSRRAERTFAIIRAYQAPVIAAQDTIRAPQEQSAGDRFLRPLLAMAAEVSRRLSPAGAASRIEKRLDYAGNPVGWTAERILAWKALAAVVVGAAGLLIGHRSAALSLILMLAGLVIGFFVPDLLLYNAGEKRQQRIQRELPDALDLLVISVEAGLGFDAALLNVAQKMGKTAIAGEFVRVLQEMQIGRPRADAFRSLGERTTVSELRGFVNALVQADRLGIPIAAVLREQAAEMRTKRQQRAEEKAQKVPVKILFPLVLCILPSLFIVVLGPAFIQIYHTIFRH